ncbi:MAG TPA: C2 family cysteine protease [Candidatus Thermoplasmatota archaeon]|nr:C2 family cysteine protease [Candidatus Thermoplasmatota archaeon]
MSTRPNEAILNTGVVNPYALAELVAGRKIAWSRVPDRTRLLEDILQTPYSELFDPQYDSPLYLGLKLAKGGRLEPGRSPLMDVKPSTATNDLQEETDLETVRQIRDLSRVTGEKDVASLRVERLDVTASGGLRVQIAPPREKRLQRIARAISPEVMETVAGRGRAGQSGDFNPPNATWQDAGTFFNEGAEFFDPIQGAVANCYLIAAMASVAWARPYTIAHRTRATGPNQPQFTQMIRFFDTEKANASREVEVTDLVPVGGWGGEVYCRSSEEGETWPAIYEKAYAKWKTNHAGDKPDITATAWGDPCRALGELTGLPREYVATTTMNGTELWNKVRENSLSRRTFNPVVAWTYSSGEASPDKVNYGDANLVAAHAYSVLGWDYRDGVRYIILRNPWGVTEASKHNLTGTWFAYDISWWRGIPLATVDGTFGITADAFKKYFACLGIVK